MDSMGLFRSRIPLVELPRFCYHTSRSHRILALVSYLLIHHWSSKVFNSLSAAG